MLQLLNGRTMSNNGLVGTIPSTIGLLTDLQTLYESYPLTHSRAG